MCKCIKQIEVKVKNDKDAIFSRMEHFGATASVVRIIPRRKDGSESKISRYIFIDWKFCPFCGELIK